MADSSSVGWPFENYAVNLRRWNTSQGPSSSSRIALVTPRHKHTFFIEFILGPGVSSLLTTVKTYLDDYSLYASLKSVDLPKPKLATDTLRSYNRYYKVQKKIEYDPFTIRFYDDSTSMITALIKDMVSFVNYSGELGYDLRTANTYAYTTEFNKFSTNLPGVEAMVDSDNVRSQMETRPSLGMKLRDCGRMFFESIVIYDLGTDPDSINIYTYLNPHLVAVETDGRDQSDSGVAEISLSFEFENYMFSVGQPKNKVRAFIDHQLGKTVTGSPEYTSSSGHATQAATTVNEDALCTALDSFHNSHQDKLNTFVQDRQGLGNFSANSSGTVTGTNGQPAGQLSIDPRTGQPFTDADFGNNADSALAYFMDRLTQAQASYQSIAGKGIVSPQVEQYRLAQIGVLQNQVTAIQQYQTSLLSGAATPYGAATNSASINTVRALIAGVGSLTGANGADVQSINNVISANLVNTQKANLEAQAIAEDQAQQASLAAQSLAKTPAENIQLASDAEYHRQQAATLRAQAAAITAPPQFPIGIPEYSTTQTSAGNVISAVTRAAALQAIGQYLSLGGL